MRVRIKVRVRVRERKREKEREEKKARASRFYIGILGGGGRGVEIERKGIGQKFG